MARYSTLLAVFAVFAVFALATAVELQQEIATRKLLQGWPEPPINVHTSAGPIQIRRYPISVQNLVGLNWLFPNAIWRGRGSN